MTTVDRLPEAFREKMRRLLGAEAEDFFASFGEPRAVGLRANPLKVAPKRLAGMLPYRLQPVPWCEDGFVAETADSPATGSRMRWSSCVLFLEGSSQSENVRCGGKIPERAQFTASPQLALRISR